MKLKRYTNEIIVVFALLLMLGAYMYKNHQITQQTEQVSGTKYALRELQEVVALEKIWGDKKIAKKITALQQTVPKDKVKWIKNKNKITAKYSNLNANELNRLITKILNTPVIITLLDIVKIGKKYNVEFACKW